MMNQVDLQLRDLNRLWIELSSDSLGRIPALCDEIEALSALGRTFTEKDKSLLRSIRVAFEQGRKASCRVPADSDQVRFLFEPWGSGILVPPCDNRLGGLNDARFRRFVQFSS